MCRVGLPRVEELYKQSGDKIEFIGVNIAVNENLQRIRRFIKETNLSFKNIYDKDHKVTKLFKVMQTPTNIIIDRNGVIKYKGKNVPDTVDVGGEKIALTLKVDKGKTRPESGKLWKDPYLGMEFIFVKGGCYKMGDTFGDGESDQRPAHGACVDDFYMGKYEVTVGQYIKFVTQRNTHHPEWLEKGNDFNVYTGSSDYYVKLGLTTKNYPIVGVSRHDATAFAMWLFQRTGKRYRLPTEAEWEYAARSRGKNYKYSWGDGELSGNVAIIKTCKSCDDGEASDKTLWVNYDDGYTYISPVGSFKPNELGLYDMTGNAWEWVHDWYGISYYKHSPKDNPKGPQSGKERVLRGGAWLSGPRCGRISFRNWFEPTHRDNYIGFRLIFSIKRVPNKTKALIMNKDNNKEE